VPSRDELPARLESVLRVVYLVFNEGYSASRGDSATRADLSGEAIRLGRLILELIPELADCERLRDCDELPDRERLRDGDELCDRDVL
jgi:predicted RNA polymerase sigma factor